MIHVITAVHNRYKITEKFIKQLKTQTYEDGIHLILVDDGSTDGTAGMVRLEFPDATILTGNGNLWWGGALQKAYLWVAEHLSDQGQDYLWIANDDTFFDKSYVSIAVELLENVDRTLLVGLGYSSVTGQLQSQLVYHDYTDKYHDSLKISEGKYGDTCSTRSLFMRVSDFLAIGGFHPVLLPHYGSDYEWTYRASKKGFTIMCDPSLKYWFDENTTGNNFYETLSVRKVFSKRSVTNPFYKLSALFLMTPIKYIPRESFKQLRRYWDKSKVILRIMRR